MQVPLAWIWVALLEDFLHRMATRWENQHWFSWVFFVFTLTISDYLLALRKRWSSSYHLTTCSLKKNFYAFIYWLLLSLSLSLSLFLAHPRREFREDNWALPTKLSFVTHLVTGKFFLWFQITNFAEIERDQYVCVSCGEGFLRARGETRMFQS